MKRQTLIVLFTICSLLVAPYIEAQQKTTTKKRRKVEKFEKGHQLSGSLGVGVSGLGYNIYGGTTSLGIPSITPTFEYAYYFNKYVGLGTGLSFTNYFTRAKLTDPILYKGMTDYQGDVFNHQATPNDWSEVQSIYQLEVPALLHIKAKPKKVGFHMALGVKLGVPIAQTYNHNKGTVSHSAYYPQWDMTLENVPGHFGEDPLRKQKGSIQHATKVNCMGYAELGMLIEVQKKMDLNIGVYGQYCVNNALKVNRDNENNSSKATRQPLGFATEENGYGSFMNKYNGIIGTTSAGAEMHPWSAGIKIGINYWKVMSEKEKKKKAKQLAKKWKDYLPVEMKTLIDTIYIETVVHDTIFDCPDIDTYIQQKTTEAHQQLDEMLSESVIWFNFDDYTPILEPAYILDSVANMLKKHPNIMLHINGHACNIGTDQYNQKLAMKRAQAVAAMLRKKGVRKDQMEVRSFGATEPFKYNKEHQLEKDRRVEIIPEIIEKE